MANIKVYETEISEILAKELLDNGDVYSNPYSYWVMAPAGVVECIAPEYEGEHGDALESEIEALFAAMSNAEYIKFKNPNAVDQ